MRDAEGDAEARRNWGSGGAARRRRFPVGEAGGPGRSGGGPGPAVGPARAALGPGRKRPVGGGQAPAPGGVRCPWPPSVILPATVPSVFGR